MTASCAVAFTGVAAVATPVALVATTVSAPGNIKHQISGASAELASAAKAVTAAKQMLDTAAAKLPAAQGQLTSAQNQLGQARSAVQVARAALAAAKRQVAEQRRKINIVLAQIEELKAEIARLSRQAYISGGNYQELDILLNAKNPNDFAVQLESVRRQARGNGSALDRMAAARQALALKMIELRRLQEAALARQADADARAQEAQAAADSAAAAKAAIDSLVSQRSAAVQTARSNKAKVNRVVEQLLAKQRRIDAARARRERQASHHHNNGNSGGGTSGGGGSSYARVPWGGQSRAARIALRFAMNQIGQPYASGGGTGPAFDCIGLVWRAWHKAGSRWPLMQVEDEAHSRWVDLIPQGQVRPGDLIMWRFQNGTDGRYNALDHIGMVIDPDAGLFVQAESPGTGVRLSNWKEEGYYMYPGAFGRVVR